MIVDAMKRLKLAVCGAFVLGFIGFELLSSNPVTGQTGGTTLAAPTNLTASDNSYNSKVGLFWDTIRGATAYRIFRNSVNNSSTATDLGTTVSNNFFDTTATAAQVFFYWVRAENGGIISNMSVADQGSRTGTAQQGGIPPLTPPPVPAGNPITATKIYLGKTLFWDEQLSSTRTVSCGTCHHSANGGADPRSVPSTESFNPGPNGIFEPSANSDDIRGSLGVPASNADGTYIDTAGFGLRDQVTNRKSTSHINAGYPQLLFWDGRATGTFRDPITNSIIINAGAALESQVLGPPLSTGEMSHNGRDWVDVATRVAGSKPLALSPTIPAPLATWIGGRSYADLFLEAFGTSEVTPARIALAIATFERSLYSDRAPIDMEVQGIPSLTAQEIRGRNIFNSPANNCAVCHTGNRFTDESFRYIGVRPDTDDTGREQVTALPNNRGEFRVPSLRNVELRSSFFHNGRFTTLEQVVAFYNRGGDFDANNKPNLIANLGLTAQQQADLVSFLKRPLTDPRVRAESERFDRPELYTESTRVPQITGTGRAGSGSFIPQIKAIAPPMVGNQNFTVSVNGAMGNANAVLVIDAEDPGAGTSIPPTGSFARVISTTQNTGSGNGWTSVSIPIPDNASLIGRTFFARWYIADLGAMNGFSVSQAARFTVFGEASAISRATHVDLDGDHKTDISIFRPSTGQWWYSKSSDNTSIGLQFGSTTDEIVPADYSGDGKTDVAVWRQSTGEWLILRSEDNSFYAVPFGSIGDITAPADYDNDGRADIAMYRPTTGTWFIQASTQGTLIRQFGIDGDIPQTGDYDADGKADLAIFRPSNGQWWINRSTAGVIALQFGASTDKPVAQDFTGDGKTDVAFFRPSSGEWFVLRSEDFSYYSLPFGITLDIPAPGDYDGDGKADVAIFRPSTGTWYLNRSTQGTLITAFGLNGDQPAPSAYVP